MHTSKICKLKLQQEAISLYINYTYIFFYMLHALSSGALLSGRDFSSQGQRIPRDTNDSSAIVPFICKPPNSELILPTNCFICLLYYRMQYSLALSIPELDIRQLEIALHLRALWNHLNWPILILFACLSLPFLCKPQ